jgi:membrane-associated protease RseP (regulator of RpoE activity)
MIWRNETDLLRVAKGLPFSIALLFILSCHEFGHYFAARRHGIRTSLPYYLPFPTLDYPGMGTLGAVIRIRQPLTTRRALFDVGVAGPFAGFAASLLVLAWGFTHLPSAEYILAIHPDFDFTALHGAVEPGQMLTVGNTLLYDLLQRALAPGGDFIPPMWEMYHYPFLFAGWLGLLVTTLNLLPAGQLDGGHILFSVSPATHKIVSRVTTVALLFLGLTAVLPEAFMALQIFQRESMELANTLWFRKYFWPGWLFWALFLIAIRAYSKQDHPPVEDYAALDGKRLILGCFSAIMFILSFTPAPVYFQ